MGDGKIVLKVLRINFMTSWNCSKVNATVPFWWQGNIGSGNGLVQSGNRPLLLQLRHNERDGVSNYQPDCLLNRLFRRRSKKNQSSASMALWGEFTGHQWIPRTQGQ